MFSLAFIFWVNLHIHTQKKEIVFIFYSKKDTWRLVTFPSTPTPFQYLVPLPRDAPLWTVPWVSLPAIYSSPSSVQRDPLEMWIKLPHTSAHQTSNDTPDLRHRAPHTLGPAYLPDLIPTTLPQPSCRSSGLPDLLWDTVAHLGAGHALPGPTPDSPTLMLFFLAVYGVSHSVVSDSS